MTVPHTLDDSLPPSEEPAPFFATEDAFLQAVYANWTYFIRFLIKHYPQLFERERETGSRAPINAGWWVCMTVPRAHRTFDALLGRCDVQDILLDAMERCLKPLNTTHYTRYTPLRRGCRVQFTTWFVSQLRSCAWSRCRTEQRRRQRAKPRHQPPPSVQEKDTTAIAVDTFIAHALATPEDMERESEERPETAQSGEPSHDPYNALDARLDLATLMVTLTEPEQTIVRTRLTEDIVGKELAEALDYTPSQVRSKMSYIVKKMRSNIQEDDDIFPHNIDNGA